MAPVPPPGQDTVAQPGDSFRLRLDSLAAGGEAVGRHDGLTVFVEHGAPGDAAQVRVSQARANYARAKIERLIEPGAARVEAPCPYFPTCGGCQWQHLDYAAQVRAKDEILRDSFLRIAGLMPREMLPPVPMPAAAIAGSTVRPPGDGSDQPQADDGAPWRYRGAAEYSVAATDPPALGFLRARSSEVIPIADCLVQHPLNVDALAAANQWLASRGPGSLWLLRTRASFADSRALVTLVFREADPAAQALAAHLLSVPGVAGVSTLAARDRREQHRRLSQHIAGAEFIFDEVAGRRYRLGADTFFQVNPPQAGRLVELALDLAQLQPGEVVIDGYCGAGTFLLPLAERAGRAIGIESNPAAVRDARANLRRAGLGNATVLREKVERALPLVAGRGGRRQAAAARPRVIVLDPPRQGCGREVINAVAAQKPRAVVMVSCDPATLARDALLLAAHGYEARRSAVVDMFAHSWRVESVTLFER